jgi:hypothetical protein
MMLAVSGGKETLARPLRRKAHRIGLPAVPLPLTQTVSALAESPSTCSKPSS